MNVPLQVLNADELSRYLAHDMKCTQVLAPFLAKGSAITNLLPPPVVTFLLASNIGRSPKLDAVNRPMTEASHSLADVPKYVNLAHSRTPDLQ